MFSEMLRMFGARQTLEITFLVSFMNCSKQKYLTEGTIIPAKSLTNLALIVKKREFFCRTLFGFAI